MMPLGPHKGLKLVSQAMVEFFCEFRRSGIIRIFPDPNFKGKILILFDT